MAGETTLGGVTRDFYFSKPCPDWPWGPPTLLKWVLQIFSAVRWLWYETDHSPPSGDKVRT